MRQGVQKWGQMHPKPNSCWGKWEIIAAAGCSLERRGEVRRGEARRGRASAQRERTWERKCPKIQSGVIQICFNKISYSIWIPRRGFQTLEKKDLFDCSWKERKQAAHWITVNWKGLVCQSRRRKFVILSSLWTRHSFPEMCITISVKLPDQSRHKKCGTVIK